MIKKKAIENYNDNSLIEVNLVVNGEAYNCMPDNAEVSIKDESGDIAGLIEIEFREDKMKKSFPNG